MLFSIDRNRQSVSSYFINDASLNATGYSEYYSEIVKSATFIGNNYLVVATLNYVYLHTVSSNGMISIVNSTQFSDVNFTNAISFYNSPSGTTYIYVGYQSGIYICKISGGTITPYKSISGNGLTTTSTQMYQTSITNNNITTQYLYIGNYNGPISIFSINSTDGTLTAISNTENSLSTKSITGTYISATQKSYLYVANDGPKNGTYSGDIENSGNIMVYQINSDGTLNNISTLINTNINFPTGISVISNIYNNNNNTGNPSNNYQSFVCIGNYGTSNLLVVPINNSDGTLNMTLSQSKYSGFTPGVNFITNFTSNGNTTVYALNTGSGYYGGIYSYEFNNNYNESNKNYLFSDYEYIGFSGSNNYGQLVAGTITAPTLTDDITNPIPISNICFPAGTPIQTNQGEIAIEKIDTKVHTIRNKKIVDITKTISPDKYLVCIEKDALGNNIPSQETKISKNHCIYYNGKMIKAKDLLGDKVSKVKYNGEVLYNVLLEEHDKMVVNNLICETLHPDNCIAQLSTVMRMLPNEEKKQLINKVNEVVINNKIYSNTSKKSSK